MRMILTEFGYEGQKIIQISVEKLRMRQFATFSNLLHLVMKEALIGITRAG